MRSSDSNFTLVLTMSEATEHCVELVFDLVWSLELSLEKQEFLSNRNVRISQNNQTDLVQSLRT
jgi:hypothetical protein